jgi:hypothetical protein
VLKWQQYQRRVEHGLEYGSFFRRAMVLAEPLAMLGLAIGAGGLLKGLLASRPDKPARRTHELQTA